jgi:phage tail sheath protein FI
MPEYLAPGVYLEEVAYRSKPIEGVSTCTKGFIGSIRLSAAAVVRGAAVVGLGVLLGVVAAIAADRWRRRPRRVPPTP